MIEHVWTVLCSRSIVDDESNNLTLIDCLEQFTIGGTEINPVTETVVPVTLEVVTLWSRSGPDTPGKCRAHLSIILPSSEEVAIGEYEVDLTQVLRHRSRSRLFGLKIVGSGMYRFRVQRRDEASPEWVDVASIPLQIAIKTPTD